MPSEPVVVSNLGKIGLSQIIAFVPAFDKPDNYFNSLADDPSSPVLIRPLISIRGDNAMLFEVSTQDNNEAAYRRIEDALKKMLILANVWNNPEAFMRLMYPETGPG